MAFHCSTLLLDHMHLPEDLCVSGRDASRCRMACYPPGPPAKMALADTGKPSRLANLHCLRRPHLLPTTSATAPSRSFHENFGFTAENRGKGLQRNLFSICFELHYDSWISKRDTIRWHTMLRHEGSGRHQLAPFPLPAKPSRSRRLCPCLDTRFRLKFYYAKKRFSVTSKCRHMHEVSNVDEIKN
jgi:hypothetical protein